MSSSSRPSSLFVCLRSQRVWISRVAWWTASATACASILHATSTEFSPRAKALEEAPGRPGQRFRRVRHVDLLQLGRVDPEPPGVRHDLLRRRRLVFPAELPGLLEVEGARRLDGLPDGAVEGGLTEGR